jgi:hypothetical protein
VFPEKAVYPFRYALANHELGTIWFRATILGLLGAGAGASPALQGLIAATSNFGTGAGV